VPADEDQPLEDEVDADAPDTDGPEAGDPASDRAPIDDEPTDDGAVGERGTDLDAGVTRDRLSSPSTRKGLVLAGVLVLGLVVGRVTAPGDDDSSTGEAPVEEGGGIPFPNGDQDRTNYWGLAGLVPVARDTFDRADTDGLGETNTGQTWETVDGSWNIAGRAAAFGGSGGQGQSLAIAADPSPTGAGLFEVTLTTVDAGSGLVFRYLDRENFWTVTARPNAGVWTINRVVDGQSEVAGEFEGTTEDEVTVTVIQNQGSTRFLIDGEDQFVLNDTTLGDQLQGGLVARAGAAGTARWDQFMVMGFDTPDS
jgi:hypothetical protein